jgi:uncharacterized protein (DUF1800 family)
LKDEIDTAVNLGLAGTIAGLFATLPVPEPPVYYDYQAHPDAGLGESWVDLPLAAVSSGDDSNARRRSVENWWFQTLANPGFNIRGKMCFFWHNHFGIDGPGDGRAIYQFVSKYFACSAGNFRELVREMTINPSMLAFLDGNSNARSNPNENFAREILELFTVGKGPLAGEGDYTNYTEQDVAALARAFTGWRTRYFNTQVAGQGPEAFYQSNRHDTDPKQLSHRFDNAVINDGGASEYSQVVDIIFQQDESSRHICRKLYRHFVYYKIDEVVAANIIEPMAQLVRDNDYELAPALMALFQSQHFYAATNTGNMIKTPLDLVHSVYRLSDYANQGSVYDDNQAIRRGYVQASDMGLELRNPPSVSGWTAYYQSPAYYRLWLNTATLQQRNEFFQRTLTRNGYFWNGSAHPFGWLATIERYDNPGNAELMIADLTNEVLPQPAAPEQLAALKELLLPNLEDFVWTMEYADLRANPNDANLRNSVLIRLQALISGVFQLAEFQLH